MQIVVQRSRSWRLMTRRSAYKAHQHDRRVLVGPAELRNLLMHLALTGLFRARWSADVHEEWMTSLLRKRPDLTRDKLERTRLLMDRHAVNALVTGYKDLIPGLQLPTRATDMCWRRPYGAMRN